MPVLIAGGSQLIGGAIKAITGGSQKRKARRLLAENPMPEYNIPTEVTQAAAEGLPSQQYDQAMKNIQRQQLDAIKRSQDRRSGIATIGKIQDNTNSATLGLDVADAKARQQNQLRLGQYRDKAWDWNKKQKYERNYQYAMNLLGAGNQNFIGGIEQGATGLLRGGSGAFLGGGNNEFVGGY